MFHSKLTLVKEIFYKNSYPEDFTDRCFKLFFSKINILKRKIVPAVEKNPSCDHAFLI